VFQRASVDRRLGRARALARNSKKLNRDRHFASSFGVSSKGLAASEHKTQVTANLNTISLPANV
jgi:hypothetical protein